MPISESLLGSVTQETVDELFNPTLLREEYCGNVKFYPVRDDVDEYGDRKKTFGLCVPEPGYAYWTYLSQSDLKAMGKELELIDGRSRPLGENLDFVPVKLDEFVKSKSITQIR